ncbi:MAG: glycerophosphodiester phosphodiesterase family protein [Chloroflexota bacterium]|jgi:glycerophosphoryl diester phosphodiesterase
MSALLDIPQPVIFAHRGASAHAPENTLSAFRLAVQHQADAIELDAKLSADGEVMVIHDQTVDRTTNASGKVSSFNAVELQGLDAGSHFSAQFKGEPVPTLEQVLAEFGNQVFINIELTNYASPRDALPEKAAALVKKFHLEARVLFSSFHPNNLRRVARVLPQCPLAILALPGVTGMLMRSWLGLRIARHVLHPHLRDASPALITREHKRRRRVHVWTVNDPQDMRRLFRDGVDGIFTDDPLLAHQIRNGR